MRLLLSGRTPRVTTIVASLLPAVLPLQAAEPDASPQASVVTPAGPSGEAGAGSSERLAPEEARALVRRAQRDRFEPGTYRLQTTRKTKTGSETTTTLTHRRAGQPTLTRIERVAHYEDGTHGPTRVTLTNADGTWLVLGGKAILLPRTMDLGGIMTVLQEPDADSAPARRDHSSPAHTEARAVAAHVSWAGERFTEGDRRLVRVTQTFGPPVRKYLQEQIDRQIAELKKQLALAKRILVSSALAVKGGTGSMIPGSQVYVIDADTGQLVRSEVLSPEGKSISKEGARRRHERIDELPASTFALPENVEIIRPKTYFEAIELADKLKAERDPKSKG